MNFFHRILSTLVITIIFPQTNFSPSTSLVPISLNGISRLLQLNRAQMEHVTFTSRPTGSLCPMQCGLQSPVAQPQTCRGCVLFSSSRMMGNHMDLYWDITPKHPTFHPVPLASSAVLVYNHRNDLQHLTLNSPGSLLQLSLRQEGGRAQPLKE